MSLLLITHYSLSLLSLLSLPSLLSLLSLYYSLLTTHCSLLTPHSSFIPSHPSYPYKKKYGATHDDSIFIIYRYRLLDNHQWLISLNGVALGNQQAKNLTRKV